MGYRSNTVRRITKFCDTINTNYPEVYKKDFDIEKFIHAIHNVIITIDKMKTMSNNRELGELQTIEYIFQPITQHEYNYQDIQIDNTKLDFLF